MPKKAAKRVASDSPPLLYQFKITLKDIEPKIWRRIQVPDCRLADFDNILQGFMGWQCCHMHQFIINGEYFGELMPDIEFEVKDEYDYRLSYFIPENSQRFKFQYEYDFGDGWITATHCFKMRKNLNKS